MLETIKNIDWKNISTGTIIRAICTLIAIANFTLTTLGANPLPITENDVMNVVINLFSVIAIIYGFWKNNNFTSSAQISQDVCDKLKQGQSIEEVINSLTDKIVK